LEKVITLSVRTSKIFQRPLRATFVNVPISGSTLCDSWTHKLDSI